MPRMVAVTGHERCGNAQRAGVRGGRGGQASAGSIQRSMKATTAESSRSTNSGRSASASVSRPDAIRAPASSHSAASIWYGTNPLRRRQRLRRARSAPGVRDGGRSCTVPRPSQEFQGVKRHKRHKRHTKSACLSYVESLVSLVSLLREIETKKEKPAPETHTLRVWRVATPK